MSLWGNKDQANNAPSYVVNAATGETGVELYGDTVHATLVTTKEPAVAGPGWVNIVKGKGQVTGIEIVSGGTGYDAADTIEVGPDSGTITVDENGVITAVDIQWSGADQTELPEVEVTTEDGTGASFKLISQGQMGRVRGELLVAMKTIQA